MELRSDLSEHASDLRRVISLDASAPSGVRLRTHGSSTADDLRVVERPSPRATVVIPARNEEGWIARCLASVLAQDEPNIEVLVIDGASTDRTRQIVNEIAAEDRRVRMVLNPKGIIPAALNLALEHARAPYVVRVDAHSTVPTDYVGRALGLLEAGEFGAVGGRKDCVAQTAAGHAVAVAMGSRFGVGNSTYHYGTEPCDTDHVPFGAYPVEVARSLGGWDERLRVNQDFAFDYELRRAGHRIRFDPSLRIQWHSRQSIRDFFGQYLRYGRGKARVIRIHPRSTAIRHLVAPALVTVFVAAAVVAAFNPLMAGMLVAPYGAGLVGASAANARRAPGVQAKLLLPVAFLAMHFGWGLGFWRGVAEWPAPMPERIAAEPAKARSIA